MIHYALVCTKGHEFDGWFSSSSGFEEQVAAGDVRCPVCNSKKVRRALMAPAIAKGGTPKPANDAQAQAIERVEKIVTALRRHVEEHFDYVGGDFAEEARRIHYGETEHRDIYGETTLEEAEELIEEGVELAPLPNLQRNKAN